MYDIFISSGSIPFKADQILSLYKQSNSILSNVMEATANDAIKFYGVPKDYFSIVEPFSCSLSKDEVQKAVEDVKIDAILELCITNSAKAETTSILSANKKVNQISVNIFGRLYDREGEVIWSNEFSSSYDSEEQIGVYREDIEGSKKRLSFQMEERLFYSVHELAFNNSLQKMMAALMDSLSLAKEE
jgi:hypothetical protein